MEQLRLGLPPRDPANPLSRLLVGLFTVVLGLAIAAVVLFVAVPIAGIILSAAVGGVLLTLAGIVMMIPFLLVAGTVLVVMNRTGQRKASPVRARSFWQ